ncbi:hypothetical protein P7C70_g4746, partial [Phenoliferia sp. Uapishka_3]
MEFTPLVLKAYLRGDHRLVLQMGRAVSVFTVWLAARLHEEESDPGVTDATRFATRREVVWTQSVALEPCDVKEMVRAELAARHFAEERELEVQIGGMLALLDRSYVEDARLGAEQRAQEAAELVSSVSGTMRCELMMWVGFSPSSREHIMTYIGSTPRLFIVSALETLRNRAAKPSGSRIMQKGCEEDDRG